MSGFHQLTLEEYLRDEKVEEKVEAPVELEEVVESRPDKVRGWVATIYNVENDRVFYQSVIDDKKNPVTYIAWGVESCPTTGRLHHQAFFYTKNSRSHGELSKKRMGKWFGVKHSNIEPMWGTFTHNKNYCSKDGIYDEVGKKPSQGVRADLNEMKDQIMDGTMSVRDIRQTNAHAYHLYGRTLEKLQCDYNSSVHRSWTTKGYWLYGDPECGKSHHAGLHETPETHYRYPYDGRWWDDYMGQEIVIFDDFRPDQVKYAFLLRLMDKYPMTVPRRGQAPIPFLAKSVIITCVRDPKDCFRSFIGEDMRQMMRRLTVYKIEHMVDSPTPWLENGTEVVRG